MKLLAAAAAFIAVSIAQPASAAIIDLDWSFGSGTSLDATIFVGDTVRWTLTDGFSHTVQSTTGTESFNSGTLTGIGMQFSHTFTSVGATNYLCGFHPFSMGGTITVTSGGGETGLPALGGGGIGGLCLLLLGTGFAISRFRRGKT